MAEATRPLLTVREFMAHWGIGRDAAYALCHRPDFPVIRVGTQFRVLAAALDGWLAAEAARQQERRAPGA